MSTGTFIIERALRKISAGSVNNPAVPESINDAFYELNSMMEEWRDAGINVGQTPLEVPGSELNEVASSTNGIITNLAVRIAPEFNTGREVLTQNLVGKARSDYHKIKRRYGALSIPLPQVTGTLPVGSGNESRDFIYFDDGDELGG